MPGLEPFHVRQIRMVERVLGQKVSPRDHAMIDCLAERMERYGWHSVSINPVPLGYQYIIQAKSEKRREDEARQRAAQDDCDRVVCAPQMLSSATTKVGARRAVTAAAMPAREPLIHTSQSVRGN